MFTYCPRCSKKFAKSDKRILQCSTCDFHFYINPAPCNGVIIENKSGEILLVKRKFEPKKGYWDFPGGFIEFGETAEESVMREIEEELKVTPHNLRYIGSFADIYEYKGFPYHTLGLVYSAKIGNQKITIHDDITDYQFFAKDKIPWNHLAFESLNKALKLYLH